jgi:hypothetical protein
MLGAVWFAFAVAVGVANPKDEPSLPQMRCANFRCRKASRRCSVIHFSQVAEDMVENAVISRRPGAGDSIDVLEEDTGWLNNPDTSSDGRPKVAWIFHPFTLSGVAKWLAREAARYDVHQSSKLSPWEIVQVRERRS